jgi:cytochrome c oxidase cbb3-type subunit I/II
VWRQAKCWECHGDTGKGDGEKAPGLKDDLKFPLPPADLTTGQFKSGPAVEDIFRTMTTGLSGTPMPSYRDSLPEQDRWALSYYVLALSAFKDPLTGQPLRITEADRQALNNPALHASTSAKAYKLMAADPRQPDHATASYAGAAWARRHGVEVLSPAASAPGVPPPSR